MLRNSDGSGSNGNMQYSSYVTPPDAISYKQSISDAAGISAPNNLASTYQGLLYFPLSSTNCSVPQDIPANSTTLAILPPNYYLIAIVPLDQCTQSYLNQARIDGAQAAVVYNYTTAPPTGPQSVAAIQSSITSFPLPIYGLLSSDAVPLLDAMQMYSGDLASAPFGSNLTANYGPNNQARLVLSIDTGNSTSLPGLWLFLLVILAALGIIIASTSLSMHFSQYRARRDLRRRIAAGEIDLESLGIKRLTVPQDRIDALPIKTYYGPPGGAVTTVPAVVKEEVEVPAIEKEGVKDSQMEDAGVTMPPTTTEDTEAPPAPAHQHTFETSTCAVCLDDFEAGQTRVRELPCYHAFHPECIDPFLANRSSLCPLCKRSVLPKGFIPSNLTLTNATIARERRLRQLRQQQAPQDGAEHVVGESDVQPTPSAQQGVVELSVLEEGRAPGNGTAEAEAGQEHFAPTQEDEDEEIRQRSWFRRAYEGMFPSMTRSQIGHGRRLTGTA